MMIYCYLLSTALVASLLMVPFLRIWAVTCGAMDEPGEHKVHSRAKPRIGGIAIFLSILFAILVFVEMSRELCGVLAGGLILFFTGLLDDLYSISARRKFTGEILATLTMMGVGGLYITHLGDLFGTGTIELPLWLAVPFTLFAVVGVINAINLIDGLDGLAGGVALVAAGGFFVLGYLDDNFIVMALCAAACGAIAGFLRFNVHPASIFMGDSGSLVLGFLLACTAIALTQNAHSDINAAVPVVILGLPIADTLFVMGRRIVRGKSPFVADLEHIHHKLLRLGCTHRMVVGLLCSAVCFWAGFAVILRHWPTYQLIAFFALAAMTGYLCLFLLQRRFSPSLTQTKHWRPADVGELAGRPDFDSPPLSADTGEHNERAA